MVGPDVAKVRREGGVAAGSCLTGTTRTVVVVGPGVVGVAPGLFVPLVAGRVAGLLHHGALRVVARGVAGVAPRVLTATLVLLTGVGGPVGVALVLVGPSCRFKIKFYKEKPETHL